MSERSDADLDAATLAKFDLSAGSIGRRLVLATLAFCLVFTLVTVAVRSVIAWRSNLAVMTDELVLVEHAFHGALVKAVWDMDRETIAAQFNGAKQIELLGRFELQIKRNDGRPAEVLEYERPKQPLWINAPALHRKLSFEPYPGKTENVGELSIRGNACVLLQRLQAEVLSIVVTQVLQSLLLASLIMWLFNRSVTVHVQRIAHHLEKLSPANLGQILNLHRPASRHDELSLLESGVNVLQGKLLRHMIMQAQTESDLAAHRDHLAELVNERTAELRAANARLEDLSRCDPLTGLANRRQFDEVKDIEFRRAVRTGQPLTVLMCDVDFFKLYNDTYGHLMGDQCLQALAQSLKSVFSRAGELAARIGGEEFAVLLPGSDASSARTHAEQLLQSFRARALPHASSTVAPYVTVSVGVAQLNPESMDKFDQLLQAADQALYRAKNLGRNCIAD